MPGGNRMGPMGQGPMTGRGAGYCAGYDVPGYMNPVWGRGYRGGGGWGFGGGGRGFGGGGRGFRHRNWYFATGLPGWQRAWMGGPGLYGVGPMPFPPAYSREQELTLLRQQAAGFEQALGDLKAKIQEVEQSLAEATPSKDKG